MEINIKQQEDVPEDKVPSYDRHVFQIDEKVLVASDHTSGICLNEAKNAVKVANRDLSQIRRLEVADPKLEDQLVYCIAHIDLDVHHREDFEDALFVTRPDPQQVIVLHVSNVTSLSLPHDSRKNGFVWLSMKNREAYRMASDWLPEFLKLDFEEATEMAGASIRDDLAPEIQRKYPNLLNITHPGDATSKHAFRLLCEAYLLCNGETKKEIEGISIHAPMSLKDWLAPFGAKPEDDNAIDEIAAMIGTGEIQTKVKNVLRAVGEKAQDLKSPINAFLDAASETSTQL